MELVEGQSLDQLIPEALLPVERILEIATALAEALAAAHERGVVHRDLKPANVMVASGGRVKVLDFGLAKVAAHEEATHLLPRRDPPRDDHGPPPVPGSVFRGSVRGDPAGRRPGA